MSGDLAGRIGAVDSGDQLDAALSLPDYLRDALWRVGSAGIEPIEATGLIVCGMGGSAIGGDLAAAALGSRLCKPLDVVRGYGVPSWTPPDRAIFCSSYSGNTEETIGCYAAAEAVGAQRIVATTGGTIGEAARRDGVPVIGMPAGLQPRAAVGYTFAIAAEVAALVGAGPGDPDRDRQLRRPPRGRARRRCWRRPRRSPRASTARCRCSTAAG